MPQEGVEVREILTEVIDLLERGEDFALIKIVSDAGSTPRGAGAEMVVRNDGSTAGTVGGGLLEATMMREAADAIAARRSRTTRFELTGTDVTNAERMVCGGAAEVLVTYVGPSRTDLYDVATAAGAVAEAQRRAWLLTALPRVDGGQVDFCLISENGAVTGPPLAPVARLQEAVEEATDGGAAALPDGRRVLVEAIQPPTVAIIFGAGHVGAALAPVCSSVDFRTVIVDDRAEYACRERHPSADEILASSSFEEAFAPLEVGPRSYIVIATRGHTHDLAVLRLALGTSAAYIGLMASRGKRARVYDALRREGVSETSLARVHSPVGLDIGAETPAELAVSIVAEMIAVRAEACAHVVAP
jgi:xanthine dehydrogenase accessory factor